jgi:dTDP-4-dehydrorhamnose 3,5-epimerase-like enzyme
VRQIFPAPGHGPDSKVQPLRIPDVRLYDLPLVRDARGSLSYAQYDETLPFLPRRYFSVFGVGEDQTRGGHAHRTVHQFLICVKGSCLVSLDDGRTRDQVWLDRPERALYLPPKIWATQQHFSRDGVLVVLASDVYDPAEYIKDYDEFLRLRDAVSDNG